MNHQRYEKGGSDSRAEMPVANPNTSVSSQQNLPASRRHHPKRSSSVERSHYRHPEQEQNNHGSGSLLHSLWPFVSTDQYAALETQHRELEERSRRADESHRTKERDLRARLTEKEAELEELKKTLCLYDDCSEVDIRNMVDNINNNIQSLSSKTAMRWYEALGSASNSVGDSRVVGDEEVDNIRSLVGIQFVDVLRNDTCTPEDAVGILLPLAWQALITVTVARILSSFSASLASTGDGRSSDTVLRSIGDEVMKGEAQPAYGRWRLVTHQYLSLALSNGKQAAIQAYVDEALAHCHIACRLVMKRSCPSDQDFADAFQTQLYGVMNDAFKLLTMIQESMITANYEPYTPLNGEPFDADSMVMDAQDRNFSNDSVVCTTGLGLLYWRKEGRGRTSVMLPKAIFMEAVVFTEGNLRQLLPT